MSKIQLLLVHKGNGICTLYGPKDKITVRVVKPLDPEKYPSAGSVDDQVFREAPYAWEHLMRKNMILARSLSRPYQRVIPIEEMGWWDILIALFVAMENRALARGRPNPELLQHLNHICDNPSEYGFWAQLFAPDLIEEVKQLRARRVL